MILDDIDPFGIHEGVFLCDSKMFVASVKSDEGCHTKELNDFYREKIVSGKMNSTLWVVIELPFLFTAHPDNTRIQLNMNRMTTP